MKRWKIVLAVWLSVLMAAGTVSAGDLFSSADEEWEVQSGPEQDFFGTEPVYDDGGIFDQDGMYTEDAEPELPEQETAVLSYTYVNPIYSDIVRPEDLVKPVTAGFPDDPLTWAVADDEAVETCTSLDEAAKNLREAMKARKEQFTVMYVTRDAVTRETLSEYTEAIYNKALEHTGAPTEGDYLSYQTAGYEVNMSARTDGGTGETTCTFNYALTWYTSAVQEAEMDEAVDEVLGSLYLDGKSSLEKIRKIYQYITNHVKYDYDHLNNNDYKLQFTAYAALINETSVCQGFAVLLYRLLLENGIDCRIVRGTGITEEGEGNHAWNIILLGDKYYCADATWDIFENSRGDFRYFLKGTTVFYKDHVPADDCDAAKYSISAEDYTEHTHSYVASGDPVLFCEKEGSQRYVCSCGDSYIEVLPPAGHTEVTDPARAATCTEDGLTEGSHCSVCGKVLTEQQVISAAHIPMAVAGRAATCTEPGLTEGSSCSVCKEVLVKQEIIQALGHSYGEWEVVQEATEGADGLKVRVCTRCNAREEKAIPGPAHEHTVVADPAVEPTCTESGLTEKKYCSACKAVLKEPEIITALGHDFGSWEIVREATEEEEGWEARHCSRCHKEEGRIIDKKPHTHVWSDWTVIVKPTALAEGTRERVCDSCGEKETESIPALGRTTIKASMVTLNSFSFAYNGETRRPTVIVKAAGKTLTRGKDYTVSIPTSVKVGKYKLVVTGKGDYEGTVTKYYRITKASNPMKVKYANKTIMAYALRQAAREAAPLKVSLAQGKVTYKKSSGNQRLTVDSKTGRIKVKKGTKKGTYKATIIVTAAGNVNYMATSKKVSVKIVVK